MHRFLLFCAAISYGQSIDSRFLLAYHSCEGGDCRNPINHFTHIAESGNGADWTLLPDLPVLQASVPDIIPRGHTLYLYTPGRMARYRVLEHRWEPFQPILIRDQGGRMVPFVDPSPTLDEHGRIVLFYMVGNARPEDGDPAGCRPYPCVKNFASAVEVAGSDGTQFLQQPGYRASITIERGSLSDPDIFHDGSRYIMYLSEGPNTWAYSAPSLHGEYRPVEGLPNALLTSGGSVASGHFDVSSNSYWTFAHAMRQGQVSIYRAVHPTLDRLLQLSEFELLIPNGESPGFALNTFRESLNAASLLAGRLAPGALATVLAGSSIDQILFGGVPVELVERQGLRLTYRVPLDAPTGAVTIELLDKQGQPVQTHEVNVSRLGPGLFPVMQDVVFAPSGETELTLRATGIHGVQPEDEITVSIGDRELPVRYAGPSEEDSGVDIVVFTVPPEIRGAGVLPVFLRTAGVVSNIIAMRFAR